MMKKGFIRGHLHLRGTIKYAFRSYIAYTDADGRTTYVYTPKTIQSISTLLESSYVYESN